MKLSRDKIEGLRIKQKYEKRELLEKAGCTRQNFSKLFKNKNNRIPVIEKWAGIFGVGIEEVLEG